MIIFDIIEGICDMAFMSSKHFLFLLICVGAIILFSIFYVDKDAVAKDLVHRAVKEVDLKTLAFTEKDPWGNVLKITKEKKLLRYHVTVRSAGADGEFNTQDDIVATKTRFK